jgi:hypothetical protein
MKKLYIEVVEYETDKVIKKVDVSDKSWRQAERVQDGMDRNLNHEKFYTRLSEQRPSDA